jgi:hypothetical protein
LRYRDSEFFEFDLQNLARQIIVSWAQRAMQILKAFEMGQKSRNEREIADTTSLFIAISINPPFGVRKAKKCGEAAAVTLNQAKLGGEL